jgi:hypothetical protein
MGLITQLDIKFSGSFQARLAVGMDRSDASPTDPYGEYGGKSAGGGVSATYAYKEKPFDRIIRLSKPVDLRNVQLNPWTDTVVRSVMMFVDGKFKPAPPGNALVGSAVSLGEKAKWIEGEGYELTGVTLSIGSFLVGNPTNKLEGWNVTQVFSRKADYQKEKEAALRADFGEVDPVRLKVLDENKAKNFDSWSMIHISICTYGLDFDPGKLVFTAVFGGGATMEPAANYIWGATLVFSHWDADTLCGRLNGAVGALHKSMLQTQAGTVYGTGQAKGRTGLARV